MANSSRRASPGSWPWPTCRCLPSRRAGTRSRRCASARSRSPSNICYEDAFGEEIIRALPAATLLLNISNVAWFGDSLAPAQHLQIARMRALETGRTMLRATNTGMTAIIGPDGVVQAALPPFTRAALTGDVQAYAGSTPFVRWGNVPAVIAACLLLAFARRRNTLS
ncbi:apolipoprotein N-acyltransferase [Propionivibrio sp.]|uniref:apolipoprotein N-acyltransferase n=1 Tax=Propionivibrio sp. TaxID=2212460 RepID=UPI0039E3F59E